MVLIPLDAIKPGMVAKNDVRDRSGRFLLGRGTPITDKNLHTLRAWGIIEVEIQGQKEDHDPGRPQADNAPPVDARICRKLAWLFQHNDLEHLVIRELHAYCQAKFQGSDCQPVS